MAASNTRECFREIVGKKVKGMLFDALPLGRKDLSNGAKTIVFADGTGLTIAANGTFWPEHADEVSKAIKTTQRELESCRREIEGVLQLAGSPASVGTEHG